MRTPLIPLFLALTLSACSAGSSEPSPQATPAPAQTEQAAPEESEAPAPTHACPMHPEITGAEGDDCSICGMKLMPAEPGKPAPREDAHGDHAH